MFLALTGTLLWWPRRRTAFRLRHAVLSSGTPMTIVALAGAFGLAWVSVSGVVSYGTALAVRMRARHRRRAARLPAA
jgi:uncharacterized iron-regulated membrane protein